MEQAGQHLGQGEILLDLLLAEGVARFLELFAHKRPVPGLRVAQAQVFCCKGAQFGHVALGVRAGATGQVAQKGDHRSGRVGHLGRNRQLGKVGKAQQTRFLMPQRQDFAHDRRVVKVLRLGRGF